MMLIKEAIYIRVNNPSLNRNIGKYQLPHIWDEVLNNITELKTKINNQHIDPVAIPSATLAITSAIINIPTMWPFHLPQWQKHLPPHSVAFHQPQLATTSAIHILAITSAKQKGFNTLKCFFHLPHIAKVVTQVPHQKKWVTISAQNQWQ